MGLLGHELRLGFSLKRHPKTINILWLVIWSPGLVHTTPWLLPPVAALPRSIKNIYALPRARSVLWRSLHCCHKLLEMFDVFSGPSFDPQWLVFLFAEFSQLITVWKVNHFICSSLTTNHHKIIYVAKKHLNGGYKLDSSMQFMKTSTQHSTFITNRQGRLEKYWVTSK